MSYEYEVFEVYQGICVSIKKFNNLHEAELARVKLLKMAKERGLEINEREDDFDFIHYVITRKENSHAIPKKA